MENTCNDCIDCRDYEINSKDSDSNKFGNKSSIRWCAAIKKSVDMNDRICDKFTPLDI